jgi:drug/metabolite transporter (DMT)-like permease
VLHLFSAFSRLSATARGILLMLTAIFLFTAMDAVVKGLVDRYPSPMLVWMRMLGQLLLVVALLRQRFPTHLRTRFAGLHLARALTQLGAAALFFTSLSYIGLAEATAIMDINPVLITLGAALFLGERFGPRRLFGVAAALTGALIVIRPGSGVLSSAAVLPLCAAVFYAANALITRRIGQQESIWTAMALTSVIGTGLISLSLPFFWVPIRAEDLPAFAIVGLLGTAAQFAIIRALTLAEASVVAPFAYSGIVFATGWGIVLYGAYPDRWTLIGALVIVVAGLYVWHREARATAESRT